MSKLTTTRLMSCLAVAGLLGAGCSDGSKSTPKTRRVEGVAKRINLETREVSMVVTLKDGTEKEFSGRIQDDTEVLINSRAQRLGDIREGEKVVAYVREIEGREGEDQFLVVKVEIERAAESDWVKPADASTAAQPAPPAQPPAVTPSTASDTTADAGDSPPRIVPPSDAGTPTREELTDRIFATIRIQMDDAIAKRAELLKAGADRADPEVRRLEGTIMRARALLTERGEVVEEVDPPIVEKSEPPKPDGG